MSGGFNMKTRTPKTPKLLEAIENDLWDLRLWQEFASAVNEDSDSGALKDLNQLAEQWPNLEPATRDHYNQAFIICCGYGFDSLLEKAEEAL